MKKHATTVGKAKENAKRKNPPAPQPSQSSSSSEEKSDSPSSTNPETQNQENPDGSLTQTQTEIVAPENPRCGGDGEGPSGVAPDENEEGPSSVAPDEDDNDDGGSVDKSVLTSFKDHIAYAIWNRTRCFNSDEGGKEIEADVARKLASKYLGVSLADVKKETGDTYAVKLQWLKEKCKEQAKIDSTDKELDCCARGWKPHPCGGDTMTAVKTLKEKLDDFSEIDITHPYVQVSRLRTTLRRARGAEDVATAKLVSIIIADKAIPMLDEVLRCVSVEDMGVVVRNVRDMIYNARNGHIVAPSSTTIVPAKNKAPAKRKAPAKEKGPTKKKAKK
ncbi:hypothetical protein LguiA_008586 [Lonicera macranthoides]